LYNLDMGSLQPGIYFITVENKQTMLKGKVIKE